MVNQSAVNSYAHVPTHTRTHTQTQVILVVYHVLAKFKMLLQIMLLCTLKYVHVWCIGVNNENTPSETAVKM